MNCKDQLSEAKGEIVALNQKIDDMNEPTTPQHEDTLSSLIRIPINKSNTMQPSPNNMPTISSSMPTSSLSEADPPIHHHFHYYTKNKQGEYIQITNEMDAKSTMSSDGEQVNNKCVFMCDVYLYF